jgi:hypothetical protein
MGICGFRQTWRWACILRDLMTKTLYVRSNADRCTPQPKPVRPGPGTLTGVDPKAETGVTLALQSRKNWNRILGSGSVRASMNEDYRCLGRAGVGSLCSDREQQHFNRNLEDLKPRLD